MPTVTIDRAYRTYLANRDEQVFRDLEKRDAPGLPAPVGQDIAALLAFTRGICQQVEAGTLDAKDASAQLFARLQQSEFLPAPFELGSPDNKCFEATPALIQSAVAWAAEDAPAHIAQLFAR
jgi:FADH2 O2-dependent halogenase